MSLYWRWRIRLESWFGWWDCDMCGRWIWEPLMTRHEANHTEAEWEAAGYDKPETIAFRNGTTDPSNLGASASDLRTHDAASDKGEGDVDGAR